MTPTALDELIEIQRELAELQIETCARAIDKII
jgi:hypothetical protein